MLIRVSKSLSVKIPNPLKNAWQSIAGIYQSSEGNSCQKQKAPQMTSKFKTNNNDKILQGMAVPANL